MTRKEELNQQIKDYVDKYTVQVESYEAYAEKEDIAKTYKTAVEWADKTLIKKACDWLKNHFWDKEYTWIDDELLIEDFRKAMEK